MVGLGISVFIACSLPGINTPAKVVLMAGGNGSRLFPLTTQIAKPLLPVGNVPMLAYALEALQRHKFEGWCRL